MANLQEFDFSIVLIVHDEVSLNDFIVVHLGQFTASLHVGESGGGIAYEPTSVLIAGIPHQGVKSGSEIIVNTDRDNFAHGQPNTPLFIIIRNNLIISSC